MIACVFAPWSLAIGDASVADRLVGAGLYVVKLASRGVALGVFETSSPRCACSACPIFSARR